MPFPLDETKQAPADQKAHQVKSNVSSQGQPQGTSSHGVISTKLLNVSPPPPPSSRQRRSGVTSGHVPTEQQQLVLQEYYEQPSDSEEDNRADEPQVGPNLTDADMANIDRASRERRVDYATHLSRPQTPRKLNSTQIKREIERLELRLTRLEAVTDIEEKIENEPEIIEIRERLNKFRQLLKPAVDDDASDASKFATHLSPSTGRRDRATVKPEATKETESQQPVEGPPGF